MNTKSLVKHLVRAVYMYMRHRMQFIQECCKHTCNLTCTKHADFSCVCAGQQISPKRYHSCRNNNIMVSTQFRQTPNKGAVIYAY